MKVYLIKHPGNGWWWNRHRICFTQSPNGGSRYDSHEKAVEEIMNGDQLDGVYEIIPMFTSLEEKY